MQEQDVPGDGRDLEEPAGDDETPARAQGMPERIGEVPAVRDDERGGNPPTHQREDGDEPAQPRRRRTAAGGRDLAHEPREVPRLGAGDRHGTTIPGRR